MGDDGFTDFGCHGGRFGFVQFRGDSESGISAGLRLGIGISQTAVDSVVRLLRG